MDDLCRAFGHDWVVRPKGGRLVILCTNCKTTENPPEESEDSPSLPLD